MSLDELLLYTIHMCRPVGIGFCVKAFLKYCKCWNDSDSNSLSYFCIFKCKSNLIKVLRVFSFVYLNKKLTSYFWKEFWDSLISFLSIPYKSCFKIGIDKKDVTRDLLVNLKPHIVYS